MINRNVVRVYTVTCITDRLGGYTLDKKYPVYYPHVYACGTNKNYPTGEFILDDEGDKMPLTFIRIKPNFFEISYKEVPFEQGRNYMNIWSEYYNNETAEYFSSCRGEYVE